MSNQYDVKQEVTDKYSLRGRVFNKIRDDILSGKYKEGEELREVAIGDELGVSRTPVREAFIRPFSTQATAVAQQPVPQARVSPVPRSHTRIFTWCLSTTCTNSVLVLLGNIA